MTLEEYEDYLNKNKEAIRQRIMSDKVGIKTVKVGNIKRTGRNKDFKIESVCNAFGMTKACLYSWRRGTVGIQKQFLFKVLMSLPFDVLNKINDEKTCITS